MGKKSLLQTFILLAIQGEPTGTTIRLPELNKKAKDLLTWGAPPGAPSPDRHRPEGFSGCAFSVSLRDYHCGWQFVGRSLLSQTSSPVASVRVKL